MSPVHRATFRYDKENDILYVHFGEPRPSYCASSFDDVFIMKDIETGEYSGITILDFAERVREKSLEALPFPFEVDFHEAVKLLKEP